MTQKRNTRTRILETAMKCFAEHGVAETTVSLIAKTAKIPHTLVLYHYPSMESIYYDAVLALLDELKEASVSAISKVASNPKKTLEAYVRAPFEWAEKDPDKLALWLFFYSLSVNNKRFRDLNDAIRKQGQERIRTILYEGISKKVFSQKLAESIDDAAFFIQSVITGMTIQAGTESDIPFSAVARQAQESILHFVKNI